MTSEYKRLYNALITVMPTNYKLVFSYVDEITVDKNNKTVPTTKTCAIYFKSAFNGKRVVDTGEYTNESARVILNIYGEKSVLGIEEALAYCDLVKKALDTTFNKEFYDSESGMNIMITNLSRNGNTNELGRNNQGIPVYSINYIINYGEGGNTL